MTPQQSNQTKMPPPATTPLGLQGQQSPLMQARSPSTASPARHRSPRIERRISNIPNWSLNDDSSHMNIPQHQRAPSLGDLHQELESEQEAAVNRLLGQIRHQQVQLASQQTQTDTPTVAPLHTPVATNSLSSVLARSRTPSLTSQRRPSSIVQSTSQPTPPPPFRTPSTASIPALSRQSSHRSSRTASPSLRPTSLSGGFPAESPSPSPGSDWSFVVPARERERDEVEFLKTETTSVQRENKMLEARVRELERLLGVTTADVS